MRFVVVDMQVIDPPVGGGRQRLLGLYHALGGETDYVGTWDWRGQPERIQALSPSLREHLVPLSEAHFDAADRACAGVNADTVIDVTFHQFVGLSPDYVEAVRKAVRDADVVVFSHPWCWPLVADQLKPSQFVVYEAHNVEGFLRVELLDDGGAGTAISREVVRLEVALCRKADLILSCSANDVAGFADLYKIDAGKIRIAANGAFAEKLRPRPPEERDALRARMGLGQQAVALFLGSNYGPNREAALFIAERVAPTLPGVRFVIAGGVGGGIQPPQLPNLSIVGSVSEEEKRDWLHAADIALNPMFAGSGTNVKMLEYFAAGLPVVTTETGARGLAGVATAVRVANAGNFSAAVQDLASDAAARHAMALSARKVLERHYAWECISPALGSLLTHHAAHRESRPFFSVVVPTYKRHAYLDRLMEKLQAQTFRDFEVIVVDQSDDVWPEKDKDYGFPLHYVHATIRGAVFARNSGAALARGEVIAFTDDDCEPHPGWLEAAEPVFDAPDVVGVEGLILSDKAGDPDWRCVTNEGFEGIGFMTANMFVRMSAFQRIGGFDCDFEEPHFREDTDMGWRLQDIGRVPFSREAWVFHPPHPRKLERESLEARSRFFEKDALLLRKHPQRYLALMRAERQWSHNPFFYENLKRGAQMYGVDLPPEAVLMVMDEQDLQEA
jgi:glycosyltransferase involved in cell wall biosynthesis/GT2 family glycosyltransferase